MGNQANSGKLGEHVRRKLAQEGAAIPQSTEEEVKQPPAQVFVIDDEVENECGKKVKK